MPTESDTQLSPEEELKLFTFETLAVIGESLERHDPGRATRRSSAFVDERYFVTTLPGLTVGENPALGETFVFRGTPEDPEDMGAFIDPSGLAYWESGKEVGGIAARDGIQQLVAELQQVTKAK